MKEIKISTRTEGLLATTVQANAIIGSFGIHKSIDQKKYTITHLKTGFMVASLIDTIKAAKAIIAELQDKIDWEAINSREDLSKIPQETIKEITDILWRS